MSSWVNLLKTQAFAKKMIIIHGNVEDYFKRSGNNSAYLLCHELIDDELKKLGFRETYTYDRISGLITKGGNVDDLLKAPELGEGESSVSMPSRGDSQRKNTVNTSIEPKEFWKLVNDSMQEEGKQRLFIANYSSFSFPNESTASIDEKKEFLQLRKSITEAPQGDENDKGTPDTLLILVTTNVNHLPLSIYQHHPSVKEIMIPNPSREERAEFINQHIDQWNIEPKLRMGERITEEFIDFLEGFTIRDLYQMWNLSCSPDSTGLSPKELISRYKYGEKTSPWESLNKDNVRNLSSKLKERVKGQDQAVEKVSQMVLRAYTGFSGIQHSASRQAPKGTLFFVGPTGVGKTELAKALASQLFGDEDACIRFDMSEYNHEHSDQRLVGAPPGYVGYEAGGQLTNAVKNRPFAVILFDEIEKAHGRILDKFLQILEDGRLTDGRGETVSFSDTVIIFTSNIGASEIQASSNSNNEFIKKVEEHFKKVLGRPELLNRIGNNIIPFNHLTDDSILKDIVLSKLSPIEKFLKTKYNIQSIQIKDEVLNNFISNFSGDTGGRGVLNHIVDMLIDPLSQKIFNSSEHEYESKKIIVGFENENILKIDFAD